MIELIPKRKTTEESIEQLYSLSRSLTKSI